jgi:hypothetical protein
MQDFENKGVVLRATMEVVENKGAKMTGVVGREGRTEREEDLWLGR